MESLHIQNPAWDHLSSVFSNLDLSMSQDSSYGSDVQSFSTENTSVTTSPPMSSAASAKASVGRPLKSILKKPEEAHENEDDDSASESGYESEPSDYEFDPSFDSEPSDLNYCEEVIFDSEDDSDVSSEISDHSEEQSDFVFDDSLVVFEPCVRFDSKVSYIEAPSFDDDDVDCQPEMTVHEIMELARASGSLKIIHNNCDDSTDDDCSEDECGTGRDVMDGPEEHTPEDVEIDRELFLAYMNGINGVAEHVYKPRLQSRATAIREGLTHSPFFESETVYGTYLDHVLNHVIGFFRNLLVRDEFDELVRLSESKIAMEHHETSHQEIEECTRHALEKIEMLLSDRLGKGQLELGQDELSFFAGGVLYALENWAIYTSDL
ncbi:hypothetical protein NFIA_103130 [Paecilomyces variotii No. 5]|uniref:Uncharacterized protein n=1 Tax=Byssochlamys spectabilis (strain No. 5 / NBRC 109023) TaxID=1356009 RepID=V5G5H9_BYSSN|nr:hypothetical protein NFIA_103130 [Paecilomyces variotii No. 5]